MQRNGILIVSASTGSGHTRAGEALREAILKDEPELPVQHVDLLSLSPPWVRATYGGGYELMATRTPWLWDRVYRQTDGAGEDRARWSSLANSLLFKRFRALLRSSNWQLCLCTHFLPCQLAAERPGLPPFALAITDFALHRYWVQPGVRRYFVATDTLAAELRRRARKARVDVTGIPIAPAFAAAPSRGRARSGLGLDPLRPVALIIGGGFGAGVEEMTRSSLAGAPEDVQIVTICGRNDAARLSLEGLARSTTRLRVAGFVHDIHRYIAAADLVVTKPGGLTTSEVLALGRPLLLARSIPGQEVGNTNALVASGAAISAADDRQLETAIRRVFTDDLLLAGLAVAARRLGKPDSSATISGLLRREATEQRLGPTRIVAPVDGHQPPPHC